MAKKTQRAKGKNFNKPKNYSNHGASKQKIVFNGLDDRLKSVNTDLGKDVKKTLMARSRELWMGSPLATGALKKLRTSVIGSGLRLKSTIDNSILGLSDKEKQQVENQIENVFKLWAETTQCDIQRTSNFYQIQQLAFLTSLIDGECFVLMPFKKKPGEIFELKIQLIESERCMTPPEEQSNNKIKNGVELDEDNCPIAYHFCDDPYTLSKKIFRRVEAFGSITGRRNVLMILEKERIGQQRGIPILAPVIETLLQLGRYTHSELTAAVVSSYFTVFIENENENKDGGFGEPIEENQEKDFSSKNIEMGPATVTELSPGQKINLANPTRPNTAFDGFVKAMAIQIGAALELPHDVLLSKFDSSYSASRAALLEAWKMYRMRRSWMIADFCNPIFAEFMDEAVARGFIKAPQYFKNPLIRQAYLNCKWYGATQGQIDPLKEVAAAKIRIETGLSTKSREIMELYGDDYNEVMAQSKIEKEGIDA
ncbi:MAG: phage portal protein [Cetobacterium sp.]|uniref:phage portal protein n=1 Tax=Cetobacterium sp. TaxID=2071632 RepID=UPI002FC5851B